MTLYAKLFVHHRQYTFGESVADPIGLYPAVHLESDYQALYPGIWQTFAEQFLEFCICSIPKGS